MQTATNSYLCPILVPLSICFLERDVFQKLQNTKWDKTGIPLSPLIFALLMEPLEEKIRAHPNVWGIQLQGLQHNITLFADDFILMQSNPSISLSAANEVLHMFSKVSYYKVNASKSSVMGIAIELSLRTALQSTLPYANT